MKNNIAFVAGMLAVLSAWAGVADNNCDVKSCPPGTRGVTFATKANMYYACATRELSQYTNFVVGLTAVTYQLTGQMPNISDQTGDPEYLDGKDGPNKTRLVIAHYRSAAKVRTFDEAMAQCSLGKSKLNVTVMNNPTDNTSMWVRDDKTKTSFWMPKDHVITK